MTDWSVWVLDHELPDLPERLQPTEAVPVARWAGPRFGAVLHVDWSGRDDDEDNSLSSEVEVFRRGAAGWEPSSGSGGGGWFDPPFRRPDVPPDYASVGHFHASGSNEWRCCAAFGVAGTNGSVVEVVDADGVTRLPLESPLGVFVVAADGHGPAVVRIFDATGALLMERKFSPESSW